ncbi:DUF523 domain-containing protein [Clostridium malenominatum]|uniref:DUF523 domain-containing protein n=1 Tax=Clostridium malenominatum TaxID=1539 RepID=A0ABP3TUP0_9CLOT
MILISACLCGVNCKYSGGNNEHREILDLFKNEEVVLVCPEQLGGMETPRLPHEIVGGTGKDVIEHRAKVLSKEGDDSTEKFLKGAYETLNIAKLYNAKVAILKAKSPSCGAGKIYDGTFSSNSINGNGVTAELLIKNGIKVYTEENFKLMR